MWTDEKFFQMLKEDQISWENRPRGRFNIRAIKLQCGDLILMSNDIHYRVVQVIVRDAGYQNGRSIVRGGKNVYVTIKSLDGELFENPYWNGEETVYQLEETTEFFLDANDVVGVER
jgi:hypothetical protein